MQLTMYLQSKPMPIDNGVFPFLRASSSEETRQGGRKTCFGNPESPSSPLLLPSLFRDKEGLFPERQRGGKMGGRCWVEKNAPPALRDVSRIFPLSLSLSSHAFDYTNGGVKEADGSAGKLTINL